MIKHTISNLHSITNKAKAKTYICFEITTLDCMWIISFPFPTPLVHPPAYLTHTFLRVPPPTNSPPIQSVPSSPSFSVTRHLPHPYIPPFSESPGKLPTHTFPQPPTSRIQTNRPIYPHPPSPLTRTFPRPPFPHTPTSCTRTFPPIAETPTASTRGGEISALSLGASPSPPASSNLVVKTS